MILRGVSPRHGVWIRQQPSALFLRKQADVDVGRRPRLVAAASRRPSAPPRLPPRAVRVHFHATRPQFAVSSHGDGCVIAGDMPAQHAFPVQGWPWTCTASGLCASSARLKFVAGTSARLLSRTPPPPSVSLDPRGLGCWRVVRCPVVHKLDSIQLIRGPIACACPQGPSGSRSPPSSAAAGRLTDCPSARWGARAGSKRQSSRCRPHVGPAVGGLGAICACSWTSQP